MKKRFLFIFILILFFIPTFYIVDYFNLLDFKKHTAEDFNIKTITSAIDYDQDGVDDYTDILLGAKSYVKTKPKYKSKYYEGGYPNDGNGVCTDVIWQAIHAAGYDLKELIDEDIKNNLNAYAINTPDPNIDFRRVRNLEIYFKRTAIILTNDVNKINEWQPGDIVIYDGHIGIVSDIRNKDGIPYLIHHDSLGARESNELDSNKVIGHYRWAIAEN